MSMGRNGLRKWKVTGAVAAALVSGSAWAQARTVPFPRMNVERFTFNASAQDSLVVDMGHLLPEGESRIALGLQHVDGAAVTRLGDEYASLRLDSRLLGNLIAAWAPNRWVQLEAQMPVIFNQQESDALAEAGFAKVAQNGYGTPLAGIRVSALRQRDGRPLDLALSATVGLPMGHPGALGKDDQVPFRPALSLGRDFGRVKVGGSVYGQLRSQENFAFRGVSQNEADTLNHEVGFGLAATGEIVDGLSAEVGVTSDFSLQNPGNATQTWLGARYAVTPGMELFALGGPGFGTLVGTPRYRAAAGISFALGVDRRDAREQHRFAEAEGDAQQKQEARADATQGAPPQVAEADAARTTAQGRPQGAPNALDPVATLDGVAAGEPVVTPADRDGDGVLDGQDRCPTRYAAEGTGSLGCPDTDEDTMADHADNCVFQPGPKENQGCPAHEKQFVLITQEKLQLLDKVQFARGKATILPRSRALLNQIARVLNDHPEIERLVIEAHTGDARRAEKKNLKLSQDRAEAVRRYLIAQGVDAARLEAKGAGQTSPLQAASTAQAREANRRVEFLINPPAGKNVNMGSFLEPLVGE